MMCKKKTTKRKRLDDKYIRALKLRNRKGVRTYVRTAEGVSNFCKRSLSKCDRMHPRNNAAHSGDMAV